MANETATYHWLRMRADHRTFGRNWRRVAEAAWPSSTPIWGVFGGMFGVHSSDVIVMVHGDDPELAVGAVEAEGFAMQEHHELAATARPVDPRPLERPGLYSFRFSYVADDDVADYISLSTEGWTTF